MGRELLAISKSVFGSVFAHRTPQVMSLRKKTVHLNVIRLSSGKLLVYLLQVVKRTNTPLIPQ